MCNGSDIICEKVIMVCIIMRKRTMTNILRWRNRRQQLLFTFHETQPLREDILSLVHDEDSAAVQ